MRRLLSLIPILITSIPPAAAGDSTPALTDDQQDAVASITEGRVLSTVSFLASDELAGRDTPSNELRVASAYVAARFRGAGLEPLGDDDTYFQNHTIQMTASPRKASVEIGGDSIRVFGVLTGATELISVTAPCQQTTLNGSTDAKVVVVTDFRAPTGRNGGQLMRAVARLAKTLGEKGVRAILIPSDSANPLVAAAERLVQQPIPASDDPASTCCVILVDAETADLAEKQITVSCDPQQNTDHTVRNVVGIVRGSDDVLNQEAVLVTAHLDHIGRQSRGEDTINNGADDNASGVTGVLMLADAFAALKAKPRRSVIFATFWGEEKGLRGSKEMAARPPWPLKKMVANVNFEMLGRPEKDADGKAWMTGWRHSNLGEIMNAGASRAGVEIFNRKDVGEMLYSRSDNYSFVKVGVIAHSFSAGSLHADYHQPSDEWEKLNIPHMAKVIQGLFAGTLNVADGVTELLER